jgi:outer membrane protein
VNGGRSIGNTKCLDETAPYKKELETYMKDMMNHTNTRSKAALKTLAAALAFGACAAASAQTAGTWSVAAGVNNIAPKGTTDPMSAPSIVNSTTSLNSDAQPLVDISYAYTDHISVEVGIGTPYKYKLSGAGALQGSGQLGTLKLLPPTVFAQYRFLDANAPLRPYIGLGVTYARFYDETGSGTFTAISNTGQTPTTFKVDNAWGVTPELGLIYAFNNKWFVEGMVGKTYVNTTVRLSTGQTAGATLNPVVTSLVVGYRF